MKPAPTPINETARQQALAELSILDTPAEQRFDTITTLASKIFNVPICLVSLVDSNRQWFKSCVGLDVRETGRDISFCGHAIMGQEVFMIENALEDERFADNPLVTSAPHIRFYAGRPLSAPDGHKIGTLCLIDSQARTLSIEQLDQLNLLAQLVERELAFYRESLRDANSIALNKNGLLRIAKPIIDAAKRNSAPATLLYFSFQGKEGKALPNANEDTPFLTQQIAQKIHSLFEHDGYLTRLVDFEYAVLCVSGKAELLQQKAKLLEDRVANSSALKNFSIQLNCSLCRYDSTRHSDIESLLTEAEALAYIAAEN